MNLFPDGVDGTGITPPTGGSGLRGWMSGVYQTLVNIGSSTTPVPVTTSQKNGTWVVSSIGAPSIATLTAGQLVYSNAYAPTSEWHTVSLSYYQSGGIVLGSDAYFWVENDPTGSTNYYQVAGTKTLFSSLPNFPGSRSAVANFMVRGGNCRLVVNMGTVTGSATGATGFNMSAKL